MISRTFSTVVLLILTLLSGPLCAHEVRPALLQINEVDTGMFDVIWKRPLSGGKLIRLKPEINDTYLDPSAEKQTVTTQAEISLWRNVNSDLASATIRIEGLEKTITDVLLVVNFKNGRTIQTLLTPETPVFVLENGSSLKNVAAYLTLGIKHILTGADHLMFVLGLLLLLQNTVTLIKTITAFTVAHSLTLALITLGHVKPDAPLIESLIALSIVFVAVEVVHLYRDRGKNGLMLKFPWALAFVFGLLHGSAFGGELLNIGLPSENILSALLLFNLGIETGQLMFIVFILGIYWILHKPVQTMPEFVKWIPPYAIGSFGAMWFFERLSLTITTY